MSLKVLSVALLAASVSGRCIGYSGGVGLVNTGTIGLPVASSIRVGAAALPLCPSEVRGHTPVAFAPDDSFVVVNVQESPSKLRPRVVFLDERQPIDLAVPPGALSASATGVSPGGEITGFVMRKTDKGTGRLPVYWTVQDPKNPVLLDSGSRFATLLHRENGVDVLQVHTDRNNPTVELRVGGLTFLGFTASAVRPGLRIMGVIGGNPNHAALVIGSSAINLSMSGLEGNSIASDYILADIGNIVVGRDQVGGVIWKDSSVMPLQFDTPLPGRIVEYNLVQPPAAGGSFSVVAQVDNGDGRWSLYVLEVQLQ